MLRAFLYGFGWSSIALAFHTWVEMAKQRLDPGLVVILSIIAAVVAVVFFRLAKRRKPNRSFLHALSGWLLGLWSGYVTFAVCAVAFTVIYFALF
jgi:hypothetical protein